MWNCNCLQLLQGLYFYSGYTIYHDLIGLLKTAYEVWIMYIEQIEYICSIFTMIIDKHFKEYQLNVSITNIFILGYKNLCYKN